MPETPPSWVAVRLIGRKDSLRELARLITQNRDVTADSGTSGPRRDGQHARTMTVRLRAAEPDAHPCSIPSCTTTTPTDALMCTPHWAHVPDQLKHQIAATWGAYEETVLNVIAAARPATPPADGIPHGTERGYQRHRADNTDPCWPCKAAHRRTGQARQRAREAARA